MSGEIPNEEVAEFSQELQNLTEEGQGGIDYMNILETVLNDSEKIQQLIQFIAQDDEAFREIKKAVRREFGIDIGKFAGMLGRSDPDRTIPLKERDTPYEDLKEEFYQNYQDGYSISQIAFKHNLHAKDVSRAVKEYEEQLNNKQEQIIKNSIKKRFAFWIAKKMGVV